MDTFEAWLVRRVGKAVGAGEVPAGLLTELQAEVEAARERSQEQGHAEAVVEFAGTLGIPAERVEQGLSAVEALPSVTREALVRRIAAAWLEAQR